MASKRKGIGKGLRFDVFKRDGFTCQYCGRQPPEVVLQVDHIVPVADGGGNDEMNLLTSCRACNLGKGKKRLENPQRPDADLAWLEMQQETAELRDYQRAKQERDVLMAEIIATLQRTWIDYSGLNWHPSGQVVRSMLVRYSPEIVESAFVTVAPKAGGGYFDREGAWLKYTWATMRNMDKGAWHGNT